MSREADIITEETSGKGTGTAEASAGGSPKEELSAAGGYGYDFHDAMIQIEMLFQSHILSFGYKEYSLETYADKKFFGSWKAREGCRDTDEMRAGLNIDGILRSADPSESEVLTYAQYTLNIAELCRRSFNSEEELGYDFDIRNYTELLSRIREVLKRLHHEIRYVADKEFIYLVPHDAAAEAASEDEGDPLSRAITEYRSTTLAGQLDAKRGLLAEMGRTIETYPDNLKKQHAFLYSRIEFMLNNINIREDNITGEERVERVASMTPEELEHWYDETYQLLLLRILEHQNTERLEEVDRLAAECGTGISVLSEEELAGLMNGDLDAVKDTEEELPEPAEEPAEEDRAAETHGKVGGLHTKKVVLALLIADVLFMLFILLWLFVFKGL